MSRGGIARQACRAAGGAAMFAAALCLSGCAAWRERDEFAAAKKKPAEVQLRPRGESDLPFWYSSKSRDIEESLGGSR